MTDAPCNVETNANPSFSITNKFEKHVVYSTHCRTCSLKLTVAQAFWHHAWMQPRAERREPPQQPRRQPEWRRPAGGGAASASGIRGTACSQRRFRETACSQRRFRGAGEGPEAEIITE